MNHISFEQASGGYSLRSEKRAALDAFVAWAYAVLYALFSVAFVLEAIVMPYSGAIDVSNLVIACRVVFAITGLIFLCAQLVRRGRVSKIALAVVALMIGYAALGVTVGALGGDADLRTFVAHASVYLVFIVVFLSASLIDFGCFRLNEKDLSRVAVAFLCLNGVLVFVIYFFFSRAAYLSASLYALGVPLAYFSATRKGGAVGFLMSLLLAVASMKRGLWLAALAMIPLSLYSKGMSLTGMVKVLCGALFGAAVVLIVVGYFELLQELLLIKIERSFASGGSLDEISSGRLSVFAAVHRELSEDFGFVWGAGFGVLFDAYYFFTGGRVEWITSQVDNIFGHFWLLHGYVFGSVLFLAMGASLLWALTVRYYRADVVFRFFANMYFFHFVNALFSFISWDPIWPLTLGFIVARAGYLRSASGGREVWSAGRGLGVSR